MIRSNRLLCPTREISELTSSNIWLQTSDWASEGRFDIGIVNDGGLLLRAEDGRLHRIRAAVLEEKVGGFKVGQPASLSVTYTGSGTIVYSYYKGGSLWLPACPPELSMLRHEQTISVRLLSREEFLVNLTGTPMMNEAGLKWMPAGVVMVGSSLSGNILRLKFFQYPPIEDVGQFTLTCTASKSVGWNADGTFLQFQISDMFNRPRILRIYHRGYNNDWLSLQGSMGFERVYLMSFDGFRLRLVTRAGTEFSAATLYTRTPSTMYVIDSAQPQDFDTGVGPAPQVVQVTVRRRLESAMLQSVATYAHGRLGAEIAYAIAVTNLGLRDVVLFEPSIGGKDLYTKDGVVMIQARLLTEPGPLQHDRLRRTIRNQVAQLIRKLEQDFIHNADAKMGYAILSFLDPRDGSVFATIWKISNTQAGVGYCMQAAL